jgi:hypothetical protein
MSVPPRPASTTFLRSKKSSEFNAFARRWQHLADRVDSAVDRLRGPAYFSGDPGRNWSSTLNAPIALKGCGALVQSAAARLPF